MRHLLIIPVSCRKLPQLKHISKCVNGWWIWASLCSSTVHLCSTAPSCSFHTCKVFWKAPGLSCVDSGAVRGKKVHLPWGECPCTDLLISVWSKELCIDEPVLWLLYFCGASPLRFELVMSQASVIITDSEMKKLWSCSGLTSRWLVSQSSLGAASELSCEHQFL